MWFAVSFILNVLFLVVAAERDFFSAQENAKLPQLFHLDDYERCLSQKNELYCLGEFELRPVEPSPIYKLIQEYSSNEFAFNRSILHRGYCVSTRCPPSNNATQRFESCVDKRARNYALSAHLRSASCTTARDKMKAETRKADDWELWFLNVVYFILIMNLIGTVYDLNTDDKQKNVLLTCWSLRSSWRRLTATYDDGDQRLKDLEPLHGMRVAALILATWAHACSVHLQYYTTNPNFLEQLTYSKTGVVLANGTSIIQMFVMMSSFLTAYNILIFSQKRQLNLFMLPLLIVKRIVRISPIHLFLVGFLATWARHVRTGPLISSTVGADSEKCRSRFLSHVFFVHNIVDPKNMCLMPSWFLAVDMHLYILACTLTIIMLKHRQFALRLYGTLIAVTAVMCGVVVYINKWKSTILISRPELLRGNFVKEDSFGYFYMSSWSSLPSCFIGLFIAHLHFELQERKFDFKQYKVLKFLHENILTLVLLWALYVGMFVRQYSTPLITAIYVILNNPVMCSIKTAHMYGMIVFNGVQRKIYGWHGWRVIARLSLPIMLSHFIINIIISARPEAYETGYLSIFVDYSATIFTTLLVSLLLSLFIEIPVQQFVNKLLF